MPRSSVVIGLGGTGQYILTYLKKNLLETYGRIPENIYLKSFDTMPEANVQAQGGVDQSTREIQVGDVRLEKGSEFISLTGNAFQLGADIAQGNHPHIGSWFDALYYRSQANPALWDLGAGAGQVRQFGRLAFFMNIAGGAGIYHHIENAISEIKKKSQRNQQIEILIAASFAGGTGAGMFVDMGLLCSHLRKVVGYQVYTRGFFVLPSVFGAASALGAQSNHMLARSFAAWRELDRYMSMGSDYGGRHITFQPRDGNLDFDIEARPFDICYLVDSRRRSHSLDNTSPESGVFPMVAEFMSFLLDEKSGGAFNADQSINAGGGFQWLREGPRYSVLGAYTIKVPVYYALQEYRLSLARDMLEAWLIPARNKDKKITGVIGIANQEAGMGKTGRDAALEFLESQNVAIPESDIDTNSPVASMAARTIDNTLLNPRIASVFRQNGMDDAGMVEFDARGTYNVVQLGGLDPTTYLGLLVSLPNQDVEAQSTINNEVDATATIQGVAPSSKQHGDSPADAIARIDMAILPFYQEHFGTRQGNYVVGGRFGDMLNRCSAFQLSRFAELLHQFTLNTLNGMTNDPMVARCGKLGYLHDFYESLVQVLDYFQRYLEKVRQERDKLPDRENIIASRDAAYNNMVASADTKCLFFFDAPRAHRDQQEYLSWVDNHMHWIMDDMVYSTLRTTTEKMLEMANAGLTATQQWIEALITGSQQNNVTSVYADINVRLQAVRATHVADRANANIQTNLETADYVKDEKQIRDNLRRVRWTLSMQGGFKLGCTVTLPEEVRTEDGVEMVDRTHSLTLTGLNPLTVNRQLLEKLAEIQFRAFPAEHLVIDELINNPRYQNPDVLGAEATEFSEPLFMERPGTLPTDLQQSFYIRLDAEGRSPGATEYAQNLHKYIINTLRTISPSKILLKGSEDSHRCAFIRSTENISSQDFQRWSELRDAYLKYIQQQGDTLENASRLHVFPAECNSARYEQQLTSRLNKSYRVFHPRVVTLMEYEERTSLFFRCFAYGYIQLVEQETGEVGYVFNYPGIETKFTLLEVKHRESFPTIFDVLNAFVINGYDEMTKRPINWRNVTTFVLKEESRMRRENCLKENLQGRLVGGLLKNLRDEGTRIMKKDEEDHPSSYQNSEHSLSWHPGQDYLDLADLAEMIVGEVVDGQTNRWDTPAN